MRAIVAGRVRQKPFIGRAHAGMFERRIEGQVRPVPGGRYARARRRVQRVGRRAVHAGQENREGIASL